MSERSVALLLVAAFTVATARGDAPADRERLPSAIAKLVPLHTPLGPRSEERRAGKGCRSWGAAEP